MDTTHDRNGQAPEPCLSRQSRADLVTAGGTLRRAEAGADTLDPGTAAAMIDRVLAIAGAVSSMAA